MYVGGRIKIPGEGADDNAKGKDEINKEVICKIVSTIY